MTPSARRSTGSGVFSRPSMMMVCTLRPMTAPTSPSTARTPFMEPRSSARPSMRLTPKITTMMAAAPIAGRIRRRARRMMMSRWLGRSTTEALAIMRALREARLDLPRAGAFPYARHCALSTIQAQSAEKLMPLKAACSGSREVGVRPGCVFTSSSTRRPGRHPYRHSGSPSARPPRSPAPDARARRYPWPAR